MTSRVILIDTPNDRAGHVALLVNNRLEDLLLDPPKGDTSPAPGEIYWAKVDRLVPRMGGAFVRLTPGQTGFLREAKGLKEGQGVLVQVSTYGEDGKATPVTTRILYKSRLAIHTPVAPGINISRRIKDMDQRERLESLARDYISGQIQLMDDNSRHVWDQPGIIIRSAAAGADAGALRGDIMKILTARIRAECHTAGTPPLTHAVASAPTPEEFARCEWEGVLETGPRLFDHYGVWDEIERLKSPRIDLSSDAWMAVEATRAMVTVDVNTAGEFGGGAALTANLEAAKELPRQLRLRGLGGQVIIDFAPLKKTGRRRIEEALKAAFRKDPIETTLAGWTPLGNFELQRKRERRPLSELLKPE
jgi:Ribonuclease G/E